MAGLHGGKRPGAGRKPRKPETAPAASPAERTLYTDAESYLSAVVEGREPADTARIQAARVLILYQRPRTRAPVKSPRPSELAEREAVIRHNDAADEFAQRAAAIRAKHATKKERTK